MSRRINHHSTPTPGRAGRYRVTAIMAAGLVMIMASAPIQTASACGWWGDGESDGDDGDEITVDGSGRAMNNQMLSQDTPESLTREANKLRSYGVPGYAGAASLYRRAARSGYAPAQNNLGAIYEEGLGVRKDLGEAAHWYQLAARQGEIHAQHSLGEMLLNGRGVAKNEEEGIRWIEQAAGNGHASACADLARLYSNGDQVEKRIDKAIYWWKQAEKLNYPGAAEALLALQNQPASN